MENKTPEMKNFIDSIFPGTIKAIDAGNCPVCKQPITEFRNELSKREFGISGLCQKCQDSVFGAD
jgi:hypothetical protein